MSSSFQKRPILARFARTSLLLLLGLIPIGATAATSYGADWNAQELPFAPRFVGDTEPGPLLAVSCPTVSLCVAAGAYNHLAASARPTGAPASWETYSGPAAEPIGPPPPPGGPPNAPAPNINGLSCPTSGLCVAVTAFGDVYTSAEPLAGTPSWSHVNINDDEFFTHLEAVSCPTAYFCAAVSGGAKEHNNPRNSGEIFTSHDPTGGLPAWHEAQLDPSFDLRGVSCSSPSFCLAVGQNGAMLASTNPDGPPSAWRDLDTPAGPAHLQGVACVAELCLTGNAAGNISSSVEPASPSQWISRNGGGSVAITGISCPSPSRCVAVDTNGDVITSTDPTGGADTWSFQNVLPYVPRPEYEPSLNGMFAVSCPSTELCVIAAANGTVVTSADPFAATTSPAGNRARIRKRAKRPRTILARVDRSGRVKTDKAKLRMLFRFYSKGRPRKFLCQRDGSAWRPCRSPERYWADHGRHAFRVRAIGYTGLKGPIATDHFRVYFTKDKCPCTPGMHGHR